MQRLTLLCSICAIVFGCAPMVESIDTIDEDLKVYSVNLSGYADSGFYMDEGDYKKTYKPIGIVAASVFPSAKIKNHAEGRHGENESSVTDYRWWVDGIKIQAAFDSLRNKAVKLGADAIVNIRIATEVRSYNQMYGAYMLPLRGYIITGYAIKRLE